MPLLTLPTGIDLYYERIGGGPPVLLIMGTGLDHTRWAPQVEAYRGEFECVTFDNRGTGRSGLGGGELSVRLLAEDTAALIDALEIGPAHVSGLSLGSCVAQELALMRPDLVRSLQLHGTWGRAHGYAGRKFRAQVKLLELLDLRSFYEINTLWLIRPEFMRDHPEEVDRQIDAIVAAAVSAKDGILAQYRANVLHDTLDRLGQIRAPTLVTVGDADIALPPMYGREVADAIPGAEFAVISPGGHLHNLDGAPEFNRVTLDFLRRHA